MSLLVSRNIASAAATNSLRAIVGSASASRAGLFAPKPFKLIHSSPRVTTQTAATATTTNLAFQTTSATPTALPSYLVDTYTWAYLTKEYMPILDTNLVVSSILWGNATRLMQSAAHEFAPGMRVLQPACVYGIFSNMLAEQVGATGHLTVSDVAAVQLERLQSKVGMLPNVRLELADARNPVGGPFDGVCCFFLLHEVPDDVKGDIVKALFRNLQPGGKIVFVDYHKPVSVHPLKPVMSVVFDLLEPFAKTLWSTEIKEYCEQPEKYEWSKETFFGGMYQKVIAQCKAQKQ